MDPDRLGRDAHVAGELADGDHDPCLALDLAPRARCHHGGMSETHLDRDTLRALADEGNERALDRLADAREDLDELRDLLDEGSARAGRLLTRRAVAGGDLIELQRLADAGSDDAGHELNRLLAEPRGSGEG